jgi:glycosyltransferase involved in cell wall biosynthesis
MDTPTSLANPRVSAIIIFLDGEAFLAEAIESVIAQTYQDWELLLVDDGSGPAATAIAKDYAARYQGQIRYLEHPNHANRGMSAARNLGIRHARGEYLAFLDGDDVWLPTKLADHVALLDAHSEVGMVCGATIYWHSWSGGEDRIEQTGRLQDIVIHPPDAALNQFPLGPASPASMSDIVLRADLVRQVGGPEDEFAGQYESRVFLSKIFLSAPVYFCSKPSNKYRQHPNSCVSRASRDGSWSRNRLRFLEWLERYVTTIDNIEPRVISSVRRALRPYRHPRIDFVLSLKSKIYRRCRRLAARVLG